MSVTVFLDSDEITGEAYQVDVRRGRTLETEQFDAGGGTVRVRNYSANFNSAFLTQTGNILQESGDALLKEDGDNLLLESGNGTGAGTYGDIDLGRKVIIKDGSTTVYTGFIEDVDFNYEPGNFSEAVIVTRDALATLGTTNLNEWNTTEGQLTGARVSALLNRSEVGFPTGGAARDIATGTQPLGSGTVAFGTNALQELQRISRAEGGRCFVDRTGKLVFQNRYAIFSVAASATFSDNGSDILYSGIEVRYGTDLLHFQVSVLREGSDTEQTSTNSTAIAAYPNLGVRNLTLSNLPFQSDDHALGLAQFLENRYSNFRTTISGLTVPLGRLSSANRATVAALDIGDVINVTFTPYGTSGPVTQTVAIESVQYSARYSKGAGDGTTKQAFVTFQLTSAENPDYFTLDEDYLDGPAVLAP